MENLHSKLELLFSQDFFSDDFDPEGKYPDEALELLNTYPWKDIYSICFDIFTTKYQTASELYNALNLYYIYTFAEQRITNPYDFIGYIFYVIDLNKYGDMYGDFIETFTISILDNSLGSNHMSDAYYHPWEDPNTIAALERWRMRFNNKGSE